MKLEELHKKQRIHFRVSSSHPSPEELDKVPTGAWITYPDEKNCPLCGEEVNELICAVCGASPAEYSIKLGDDAGPVCSACLSDCIRRVEEALGNELE